MADDVQLTDLEVIQRYSLAVRGASASRAELITALQADLDWLKGGRRSPAKATPESAAAKKAPAKVPAKKVPAKRTAKA